MMMIKSVIWWRKPEYPEETTDLWQVTDETFHTYGLCPVLLKFKAGNTHFSHTFHVLQGHHAMILGMDFMKPLGAIVDLGRGTFALCNNGPVFQLGPLTSKSTLARSNKPTSIPPRALVTIPVTLLKTCDEPMLIEPTLSATSNSPGYSVIPTLVQLG